MAVQMTGLYETIETFAQARRNLADAELERLPGCGKIMKKAYVLLSSALTKSCVNWLPGYMHNARLPKTR